MTSGLTLWRATTYRSASRSRWIGEGEILTTENAKNSKKEIDLCDPCVLCGKFYLRCERFRVDVLTATSLRQTASTFAKATADKTAVRKNGKNRVHLRFIGLLTGQISWAYRRPRLYTGPVAAGPVIDTTLLPSPRLRRGRRLYAQGCNESQMRPKELIKRN